MRYSSYSSADDHSVLFIIMTIIVLTVLFYGAYLMTESASEKGYDNNIGIFFICFFLGIFGYLYVVSLPDKRLRETIEAFKIQQEKNVKEQTTAVTQAAKGQSGSAANDELPDL